MGIDHFIIYICTASAQKKRTVGKHTNCPFVTSQLFVCSDFCRADHRLNGFPKRIYPPLYDINKERLRSYFICISFSLTSYRFQKSITYLRYAYDSKKNRHNLVRRHLKCVNITKEKKIKTQKTMWNLRTIWKPILRSGRRNQT